MELWVDIEDFPNYQVSNKGRVRNKRNGYILKPFADRYGYLRLSIGNTDNVYIHKLVCQAFNGNPPNYNYQINHIDSNRQNNCASNLEWCTAKENIAHGIRYGNIDPEKGLRVAREVNPKPIRIVELNKTFSSVKDCADFIGVHPTNVSRCLSGSRKGQRLHGYHLEFAERSR